MPGLSFLFKKKWHPARIDNQKQVFIKENTTQSQLEREAEAAKEVAKEEELRGYERVGDMAERDPRTSSLRFMYAQPKAAGDSASGQSRAAPAPPPVLGTGEDDEDVQKFWSRMKGGGEQAGPLGPAASAGGGGAGQAQDAGRNTVRPQTALEKQLGIKTGEFLTKAQLEERHPRLKNAPVEGGAYTANIPIKHKPFNDVVRNVRCLRCGEWGHASGDRECSLRHEVSATDLARQRREDPLSSMQRDDLVGEKQALILRQAAQSRRPGAGVSDGAGQSRKLPEIEQLVESDEEGESDPEGDFLATLTKREKKLLLRKLQQIQERGEDLAVRFAVSPSGSSSSDNSSSSSSSDSSEEGDLHRQRRSGKESTKKRKRDGSSSSKKKNKNKKSDKQKRHKSDR